MRAIGSTKKEKTAATVIFVVSALGFIGFLLPVFTQGLVNIGNATGMLVFFLTAVYALNMKRVNAAISGFLKKTHGKLILSAAAALISAVLLLAVIATVFMITAANRRAGERGTVIVLGCRVIGENASLMLEKRLNAAFDYLCANESAVCILSGGQGADEQISEAECMYRYLIEKGIEPERLYKEDRSTSTRENLAFSKEIIERCGLDENIAVATNEFHLYRASRAADAVGLDAAAIPASTSWWLFPTYYVRELYGIAYEWLGFSLK